MGLIGVAVYLAGLSMADGRPHQLVVTLSGSSVRLYVDGATPQGYVWQGSAWGGLGGQPFAVPVVPNTGGGPVQIGHGPLSVGGGSQYFTGTLDEGSLDDHALTAARVSAPGTAGAGHRA